MGVPEPFPRGLRNEPGAAPPPPHGRPQPSRGRRGDWGRGRPPMRLGCCDPEGCCDPSPEGALPDAFLSGREPVSGVTSLCC